MNAKTPKADRAHYIGIWNWQQSGKTAKPELK